MPQPNNTGSGKVVSAVKELAKAKAKDADIMLVDSAAGIGCPVIASITGSDYVLGVCEPTPSGFSDLKRALLVVKHFNIPYGIVINKFDINEEYSKKIEEFAKEKGAKILAKIPYDKSFTDALVNITPLIVFNPKFKALFDKIASNLSCDGII